MMAIDVNRHVGPAQPVAARSTLHRLSLPLLTLQHDVMCLDVSVMEANGVEIGWTLLGACEETPTIRDAQIEPRQPQSFADECAISPLSRIVGMCRCSCDDRHAESGALHASRWRQNGDPSLF